MWGNKAMFEAIVAMEWFFHHFNVGSDTLFICHDYQFANQIWLKYLAWICNPANPHRKFKRVVFAAYVYIFY